MGYFVSETPDRNGRTYSTCPRCEEGRSDGKGHYITYSDGYSYCVKCTYGRWGKRSLVQQSVSVSEYTVRGLEARLDIIDGAYSDRHSSLPRYTGILKGVKFDAFQVAEYISGPTTGYMLRQSGGNKQSILVGTGSVSYHPDISLNNSIVLVEGPYDCLTKQYVAANGMLYKIPYRLLRLYSVVLAPDGDVWGNSQHISKLRRWTKQAMQDGVDIECVVKLPHDKDPKDIQDVMSYSMSVREFLNEQKRSLF
jgi:hypothetical protein